MNLRDTAALIQGELVGNGETEIVDVMKIEEAVKGTIAFLANPRYQKFLDSTHASAVIIPNSVDISAVHRDEPLAYVKVSDPYLSFLKLLVHFHPPVPPLAPGVHPTAIISSSAVVGNNAAIGACVVVGERCRIGDETIILSGTVIGNDVIVGAGCLLYANVSVREGCRIGDRVIIHSGAVVGSDGFGFAPRPDGTYEKIPQMGIVVIEDDVEIGANCTLDRATMGETRIKRGAKLDNLIQIAHNVVVGENTVMAAQSGISGSTKIGKNSMIGGQVGFTGHLDIAERTFIGAQAGVAKSIPDPGKSFLGSPAKEKMTFARIESATRSLPEALRHIAELEKRIASLEDELKKKKE
jgi:UDP-3-O-[3-hydroxymyristoyl] glucosamine N-acyltransferase